jgi:hypothetical protein
VRIRDRTFGKRLRYCRLIAKLKPEVDAAARSASGEPAGVAEERGRRHEPQGRRGTAFVRNRDLLGKDALEPVDLLAKPGDVLAQCTIRHPPRINVLQCIDGTRQFVELVHWLHPRSVKPIYP